jgi:hypothetical protein
VGKQSFAACLLFSPENANNISSETLTFSGQHSLISQKIELFKNAIVRTPNATEFVLIINIGIQPHDFYVAQFLSVNIITTEVNLTLLKQRTRKINNETTAYFRRLLEN